ncbi:hypothetical protein sos41_00670 [Alphaproteobacteria bacterium SO-S41]|nr:hypothetical protein sos41_00670 [Alphaproteobacteria bacterium SO-S41]
MSGDDYWADYNRGAAGLPPRDGLVYNMAERAGYDAANTGNTNSSPATNGAGALVLLVAAIAAIVVAAGAAAVSAIMALPCAYLLIAITALFTRGHRIGFGDAYKAGFIGFGIAVVLAALIVAGTIQGVLPILPILPATAPVIIWLANGLDLGSTTLSGGVVSLVIGGVVLLVPGIVAFAFVLWRRIGKPYAGVAGFLRGLVAGVFVLVVPLLATAVAAKLAAPYVDPAVRGGEITTYLMITLTLVAVMAVTGGLLLGLILMACGGGIAKGGPLFGTAWFTGAVAMAIAGGTAAIAIFLFRDGDQMLQALIALTGVGLKNPPAFAEALPGFLKLTAPGAVAGGFFVAGNLYAYRGLGGWLKALAITAPFCLAALGGAVMVLAQLR